MRKKIVISGPPAGKAPRNGGVRNPVACSPLMRKGGAHERARSGKRFTSKQETRKAAREWQGSRGANSIPPGLGRL